MNSQASVSRVSMKKITLNIHSLEGETTEFKRDYVNFKVQYDSSLTDFSRFSRELIMRLNDPKISAAGQFAKSLELFDMNLSTNINEDLTQILRWIQTFTNLERLKIDSCRFSDDFKIHLSEKIKVLVAVDIDLKVNDFIVVIFDY